MIFNESGRRNAVSLDIWDAIPVILDHFEQDPAIRVILLEGAGDQAFVSGDEFRRRRNRSPRKRATRCLTKPAVRPAVGPVNRVVADDALENYTRQYCPMIGDNPRGETRGGRAVARRKGQSGGVRGPGAACFDSQDYIESWRAFMEKQRPVFGSS